MEIKDVYGNVKISGDYEKLQEALCMSCTFLFGEEKCKTCEFNLERYRR